MTANVTQFTIYDLNKKKLLTLAVNKKLGEGSFGKAFLTQSLDYHEPLVCKTIDLQTKNEYIHYASHQLQRFTYREIKYLQQLGLLIGYQHDKENQKMLIVMKLLPGVPEYYVPFKQQRLAEYASFRALRILHRQGIAHMDPHECNFLYDEKTEQAAVIDFGLAQDSHFFRELRDFYVFLKMRRTTPTFFSAEGRATLWYFIDFYCNELKEHILANRIETAQTLFCYASVIIAALCGASTLGIASILAQELIKATIMPALSQLLEALQDHYELRAFNQRQKAAMRYFSNTVVGTMIVLQGLLLALQVLTLQQGASQFLSGISQFGEICINNQSFWQSCIQAFPLEETAKIIIQLKPCAHTCQYWFNNAEKYLMTDDVIASTYQNRIAIAAKQNTFLPHYRQLKPSTLSKGTTPILAHSFVVNRPSP